MANNPLPGQLAAKAELIVNTLTQTDYQYTAHIDPDAGVYDCDCSAFVGFVLQTLSPAHFNQLPNLNPRRRPQAAEYYKFFQSLTPESTGGWHQIQSMRDARRGDIVAWQLPPKPKQDTGHVLFLAETPSQIAPGIVSVRVYDSANQPHFDDTRATNPTPSNGVGSGFIHFQLDAHGRPTAFQFAPGLGFDTFPIAIGRTEPITG